jgi:hypothetical protein
MVKKANFARNASKWHHALGGYLFDLGGDLGSGDLGKSKAMYYHQYPDESNLGAIKDLLPKQELISELGIKGYGTLIPQKDTELLQSSLRNTYKGSDLSTSANNNLLPTTGWQSGLIYAPLLGGFSVLSDALGWTNKPDYSYADAIDKAALEASQNGFDVDITPEYIGDYMAYNPFDRLFYANELGAQTAGTNRAIMNAGNANMGATTAALLANNYNGNIGLGKLFREGEEFNLDQRYKVTDFNRGTNMFNSEQNLKAQLAKADARQKAASLVYEGAVKSNALRQQADQIANANRAANITTFLDNLAGVGEHFINKFDRNALINAGVFGTLSQRPYGVSDADWEDYVNKHRAIFGACGGKLNRRKKKGITI